MESSSLVCPISTFIPITGPRNPNNLRRYPTSKRRYITANSSSYHYRCRNSNSNSHNSNHRIPKSQQSEWELKLVSIPFLSKLSSSLATLASVFFFTWNRGIVFAEAPYLCENVEMYYSGTDHLKGDELFERLNSIVSGHRSLRYREVWNALGILDAASVDTPETSPDVIEIYSLRTVPKALAGKAQGWNREHLWPRSYGLTKAPSLTDLHNIRPADANVPQVAALRASGVLGTLTSTMVNVFLNQPIVVCTLQILKLHLTQKLTGQDGHHPYKYVPAMNVDYVRGDIARSLMYMAVRYGSHHSHQSAGNPHLQLSDSPSSKNREMGLLSVLLRWNEIDPPSREEKLRNSRVCSLYQHNRNPFVDHPEFANIIWKHRSQNGQH